MLKQCKFTILFLAFIVNGCDNKEIDKNNRYSIDEDFKVIQVGEYLDEVPLSRFADSIHYTLLESKGDSVIVGSIEKILSWKDKYYIFESAGNSLMIFNDAGNHLKTLKPSGKGPGEFQRLEDFEINDKGELVLYDSEMFKVLVYDSSLAYKKEVLVKNLALNIINTEFDDYYFYMGFVERMKDKDDNIFFNIFNYKDGVINNEFPFNFQKNQLRYGPQTVFSRYENTIFYCPQFTDTIYQFKSDEIKARYFIDFGSDRMPITLLQENENKTFDEKKELLKKYAHLKHRFYETDKYIMFRFIKLPNYYTTIYDKESSESHTFSKLKNDLDNIEINKFDDSDSSIMISALPVEDLDMKIVTNYPKSNVKSNFGNIASKINKFSNPVIAKVFLR